MVDDLKKNKQMKHQIKQIKLDTGELKISFEQNLSDMSKGNVIGVAFYEDGPFPQETVNIRFKDDKGVVLTEWTHIKELKRSTGASTFLSSLRPVNFKTEDVTIELTASKPLTSDLKGQIQFYFDEDFNGNIIDTQYGFKKTESCTN